MRELSGIYRNAVFSGSTSRLNSGMLCPGAEKYSSGGYMSGFRSSRCAAISSPPNSGFSQTMRSVSTIAQGAGMRRSASSFPAAQNISGSIPSRSSGTS